jgi:hypothetical protein
MIEFHFQVPILDRVLIALTFVPLYHYNVTSHAKGKIMSQFTANISGNPNNPNQKEARVRNSPGTASDANVAFTVSLGTNNCVVLDVQPDPQNTNLNGKIYQWFKLKLPDAREGWVRDDQLNIYGDGSILGYPTLGSPTYAFSQTRKAVTTPAEAKPAATQPAAQPAAQPVPAQPAAQPAAPAAPKESVPTTPTARVIAKTGANMRAAPVSGNVIVKLDYGTQVTVIGGQPQGNNTNYIWVQVQAPQGVGFIRNSFLSLRGDSSAWGLSKGDEYPAPMANYWWVRGYGIGFPNNDANETSHDGWDLGANDGEPMLCGPKGGVVTQIMNCTKCTPDKPSTLMQGYQLGDQSIWSDPGWGFGYGNFVVIRYDHSILPASTQQRLTARNMPGYHIYALYGHLKSFSVQAGQSLTANQAFGQCGNTGNSEATHLHLQVRAGKDTNAQWSQLKMGEVEPGFLFSR